MSSKLIEGESTISKSQMSSLNSQQSTKQNFQDIICYLKKQIYNLKTQRQQERKCHQQEIGQFQKQIESLKQKIMEMREKQYLRSIMTQDVEQQRKKQTEVYNSYKKLKMYVQKLENDLKKKDKEIQDFKEEKLNWNNEKLMLMREKEKHIEISIIEKINLQERVRVLEQQVISKENLLMAIRSKDNDSTAKEMKLKQSEKKLMRKLGEIQKYETQVKNLNQFELQKLKTRITSLQKENSFLKKHISKLQEQFSSQEINVCSNPSCKKQLEMFKQKYITKSRQLARVKVELSKEVFKEQFVKCMGEKENRQFESQKSSKDNKRNSRFDFGLGMAKAYKGANDDDNDALLFNLTENDEDCENQKMVAGSTMMSYKSDILRKSKSKVSDYR